MKRQIWKRIMAAVSIIAILSSNAPDLMMVSAAEGDVIASVSGTGTEQSGGASETNASGDTPAAQTEKPAAQTEKPAAQTEKPAAQTEKPAAQTEKPASPAETPAAQTEAPARQTETPSSEAEKASSGAARGEKGGSEADTETADIPAEDKTVSLSGTCQADGQTIEGHDDFPVLFADNSDTIEVKDFAPLIDGYQFSGIITLNGSPVSQIRKHTVETVKTADGRDNVTGREIILQYSSDPSDDSSWKDLSDPASIVFSYTVNADQAPAAVPMVLDAAASHTVTFMCDGWKRDDLTETVADGETATAPDIKLLSTGILMFGTAGKWLLNGSAYDFSRPVTSDITLTALYEQIGTYVVRNTSLNAASGDTVSYTLSKDARVSVSGGGYAAYAKGTPISVPADGWMDILFSSTSDDLTVTLVTQGVSYSVMGAGTASLGYVEAENRNVTSAEFKVQFPVENVNLNKRWEDGAAQTKPDISSLLKLQYQAEGSSDWLDVNSNLSTLGYLAAPGIPEKNAALSNDSTWVYSFSKTLNGYTTDGKAVTYRLAETSAPDNYVSSYTDLDNVSTLTNTIKKPFSATKKWADGGNAYGTRQSIDAWIALINGQGGAVRTSLGADPASIPLTTTDQTAEGYIQVTDNKDGTWSVSMPNTLGYDTEDAPFTYSLREAEATEDGTPGTFKPADLDNVTPTTVYKPVYLNQGNYASRQDALYSGGTATNTLSDTAVYKSKKVWKDDNSAETISARPAASFELFRYPDTTGQSYQTASPVAGVTLELAASPADSTSNFTVRAAGGSMALPEYNEDGYKYVYFTKEILTGGTSSYKQVFVDNGTTDGNDKFLFNGGELDNTITGEVSRSAKKTWVAAARQDVDAEVTMSVFQYDPDTKLTAQLKDKDIVLSGFGTETTSKTAVFSGLPMYNENGHRYVYSVSENGVKTRVGTELQDCTVKTETVNGQTVTYFVTSDGYRYRQNQDTDKEGNITVTNTLVGLAEVRIAKTFPAGLSGPSATCIYDVSMDGTQIGTYTITYAVVGPNVVGTHAGKTVSTTPYIAGHGFTPDVIDITSYDQLDAGSYTGTGALQGYTAGGVQHVYTVGETTDTYYSVRITDQRSEGTWPEGNTYAGEKYLITQANVSNYTRGSGISVSVCKTWIDDNEQLYHDTVAFELQYTADGGANWQKVAAGSIDKSTSYTYVGVTGSAADGSSFESLYKEWVVDGRSTTASRRFRVVETKLGTSDVQADSPDLKTAHPEHETGWSFVSTSNQNYDVSPEAELNVTGKDGRQYNFGLTNKRVGVEKIVLAKSWVDGDNAQKTRPDSITFRVTASQAVDFDGDGRADGITHDYTVEQAADGTWTLDTSNTGWLQKYDYSTGGIITYSIEETGFSYGTGKDYTSSYNRTSNHVSYTVGASHTGDIDTYAFRNSLSGSVQPLMNKYWKDRGDAIAMSARPDIYPVLFRSYTDGTGTHYEKMTYQDRDWNTEVINDNWWQCKFADQPRYNEDGYEYTYYVAEEYSSVILNDYQCTGGYTDAPDAQAGTFTEDSAKLDSITVDGITYPVARLNNDSGAAGTIVNKPVAERTVSGTKVWKNLPAGFKTRFLPEVTFSLWRYAKGGTQADAVEVTADNEGKPVLEATLKSGSSVFAFSGKFPRYNNDGIPYVYIVKETSPTDMALAYTITNDVAQGLIVTNDFRNDQSYGITFTKRWDGVPAGSSVSTTLTLVRYLTDTAGREISASRNAVFATAAANGNANQVTAAFSDAAASNGVTSKAYSWTRLAYYGPNGNPYVYKVEETGVPNGYIVYNGTDKLTAAGGTYTVNVSGSYNTTDKNGTGTAGLTNRYGEVVGSVAVEKFWSTGSYSVSDKPAVTVRLWRWTGSTWESPEQVGDNILLDGSELSTYGQWQKIITGLEVYAPNGEQYSYIITEGALSTLKISSPEGSGPKTSAVSSSTAPNGFKVTNISSEVPANTGMPATTSVTNTADSTSLTVKKAWQYTAASGDVTPTASQLLFDKPLSGIPADIVCRFQYSTDNGTTWTVLNDKSGNPVEKTIAFNTSGSFGTASLNDLPTYTKAGATRAAVVYRAYEYSVTYSNGETETRAAAPDSADSGTIGSVTTSGTGTTVAGSEASGSTAITNTVPMRKITITKTWDDEYNRDGKRPASVSYTITRTGVKTSADTQQATVTLKADSQTADVNTWTASYYVPVYWNKDQSMKSTYTVAETVPEGYTAYAGTAANPTDVSSEVAIADGTADASAYFKNSHVHTEITVSVAKKWTDGSVSYDGTAPLPDWFRAYLPAALTFRLQVSTDGTTFADVDPTAPDFSGVEVTRTAAVTSDSGAVAPVSWTGLPSYGSDEDVSNLVTYHYRVVEDLQTPQSDEFRAAYSSSDITAGGIVTVTNSLSITKLVMTKTWSDQNNSCNTRPDSIRYTVQYSTDGSTWTTVPDSWTNGTSTNGTVTAAKADSYSATLDMLPRYMSDGVTKYQYRAVETALVYGAAEVAPGAGEADAKPYYVSSATSSKEADSVTTYTTAFTNTMVYTSFTVTKKWADTAQGIVSQVSEIRYYLQHKTDGGAWSYVLGSDGKTKDFWSVATNGSAADASKTMDRLPKYDPEGKLYQYRAIEDLIVAGGKTVNATNMNQTDPASGTVGGFTNVTSADGTTITNTTATVTVTASKTWADNLNANLTRPDSVTYHLLQNGTDLGKNYYKTLSGSKTGAKWDPVTWQSLPKDNAAGTAYTYTVTEENVPGYTYAVTGTGTQTDPYVVKNTPITVKLVKTDLDGKALPGSTFTVTPVDGVTFTDGTSGAKTYSNGSDWDLSGLLRDSVTDGTTTATFDYKVTETVSPNGCELLTMGSEATNRYIHLQDGKLYYISASDYGDSRFSWTPAEGNTVTIKNPQTRISFSKTDSNDVALAGAVFSIEGTFTDAADPAKTTTTPITWTSTSGTARVTFTGRFIAGQQYTVTETTAPKGYLTMQPAFTFTINQEGSLTISGTPAGATVISSTNNSSVRGKVTYVQITDQPTSFTVNKYADTDAARTTPVGGAEFTVKPVGDAEFADQTTGAKTVVTNDDGTAGLSGVLAADTSYTIQETSAPAGYQLANPNPTYTIRITNAGQLKVSLDNGKTWADVKDNAMAFSDAATNATLVKEDATAKGNPQINGAAYTLTPAGTGTFADGSSAAQELKPAAGAAASPSPRMIADGTTTYTLRETVSPAGYKLNRLTDSYSDAVITGGAMTLKMDVYGQLYYESTAADGWTKADGNALVMKDEQNSLTIKKVTSPSSDRVIATFDITPANTDDEPDRYTFADGSTDTRTFTTDGTTGMYAITGQLVAGSRYIIRELTPPAGYSGVGDFQITMNADGTVTMSAANNLAVATDDHNNVTVTVTDPQTHVILSKKGADNALIAGATFSIVPNQGGKFADGKDTMVWNTTDKALDSTNFVAGQTYYFTETAVPGGYVALPTVIFGSTIKASFAVQLSFGGSLTLLKPDGASSAPSYVTVDNTKGVSPSASITVSNTQNKVSLVKKDENGSLLANAVFSITDKDDSKVARTWTTGTSAENINGWMAAGHSYVFHETSAPAGYLSLPDFTVTMGADGKLSAAEGTTLPAGTSVNGSVAISYDSAANANTIVMKDALTTVTLQKTDSASPAAALTGSEFTVTTEKGRFFSDGKTTSLTMLSGKSSEKADGKFVAGDTYTFTESTTPDGYCTVAPFKVKVSTDGTLSFIGDHPDVTLSGSVITAEDALINAKMMLTKLDATSSSPLTAKATKFTLSGPEAFNGNADMDLTTDEKGQISVTGLPRGSYTLTETLTDANYVSEGFTAAFSVSDRCKDQTLVINRKSLGTATPFGLEITKDSGHLTDAGLTNERQTGTVNVEKLGADNKALKGAAFEVHRESDGALVKAAQMTGDDGKVSFSGLPWDTYYLVESSSPAGYLIDSTHHMFSIGYGALTKNFTVAAENPISNTKNTFTLDKEGAEGKLSGATFEVTGVFSDASDGASSTKTISDQSTTWVGLLVGGQTYTITETVPPAGYAVVPQFKVTMGTDGKLLFEGSHQGVTLDKEAVTVTVTDPQNTFKLTKAGQNDQSLDGTKFELRMDDEEAALADSWTLAKGEKSHDFTGRMTAGAVYSLTETEPAPGYTLADPVFLKMDRDGTLEQSNNGKSGWTEAAGNLITVSDTLNNVMIAKSDADGTSLLGGAGFTLEGIFAGDDQAESSVSWDSENGNARSFEGKLIAGKEYRLTENVPAPGHIISPWTMTYSDAALDGGALVIKADDLGRLYYKSTGSSLWTLIEENTIVMKDASNSVSLVKTDATDPARMPEGAVFTIKGTFVDAADPAKTTTEPIEWPDTKGSARGFTGRFIAGNTYTITETKAPDGYLAMQSDLRVTMGTDGHLSLAEGSSYPEGVKAEIGYDDTGNTAVVRIADHPTLLQINKYSAADQVRTLPLAGAVFTVTPSGGGKFADGTTAAKTITTQSIGPVSLLGVLITGTSYTIEETAAPAGYARTPAFSITMGNDGTISFASDSIQPPEVTLSGHAVTVSDLVCATVRILKTNASGTPLAGAKLLIRDEYGNIVVPEWISGTTAAEIGDVLAAGKTYTLYETAAPSGYNTALPVEFVPSGTLVTTVTMTDTAVKSAKHVKHYYDLNHNEVPKNFPGEVYDENGGFVKGASRGYDKYGNPLETEKATESSSVQAPGTGDDSDIRLYEGLMGAAAAAFIMLLLEKRRKRS